MITHSPPPGCTAPPGKATLHFRLLLLALCMLTGCNTHSLQPHSGFSDHREEDAQWQTVPTTNNPVARHEASLVSVANRLYLLGGRGLKPVNVFDPETKRWTTGAVPPVEIHHFQAVVVNQTIYLVGAMTGQWPNEKPLDRILTYDPHSDAFQFGHTIPIGRRRGAAATVVHNGQIYLAGGITNGHREGSQAWLDRYDPLSGQWTELADAPTARDHVQGAIIGNQIFIQGGRRTHFDSGKNFELTEAVGDIYDIASNRWIAANSANVLPTPRAGHMAIAVGGRLVIAGGESGTQKTAHSQVEVFDPVMRRWFAGPSLTRGRHGTGMAVVGDYVYTASGAGDRGGEPELTSLERISRSRVIHGPTIESEAAMPVYKRHHPVTLNFSAPPSSETAEDNPFLNYRLDVALTHNNKTRIYRGYYAADGEAADTGADSGGTWQLRFTPHEKGQWSYKATLVNGSNIAVDDRAPAGGQISISNPGGQFLVTDSDKFAPDFRAGGPLRAENGHFVLAGSNRHWLKAGTNSPENLLGYADFDGTYRMRGNLRDGEAAAGDRLHTFSPHLKDWRDGDPTWGTERGKALIGGVNYLANQGLNAAYFLTLNINGDGKDVWPFHAPDDLSRFDVSRLEQWNRVFSHMQKRGIALHIVLQETENELLFDEGDMGPQRTLYLQELIARFSHHPGLIWNLGEENGPVHWRPEGQNTAQRKAMARFLKTHDPNQHPVLLHTHAEAADKDAILGPLLGFEALDGLSFQVADRTTVNQETKKWIKQSTESGHRWLITMDEIGQWHTGAPPDLDDPTRDSLRRHALWGHLLAGGAGVEWYFGAQYPANDLTSEDWRLRGELWRQTRHAHHFFTEHLQYFEMTPCAEGMVSSGLYCLQSDTQWVVYQPAGEAVELRLTSNFRRYVLRRFDPISGEMTPAQPGQIDVNATSHVVNAAGEIDQVLLIEAKLPSGAE